MKNLIFLLVLVLTITTQAQNVIELKEANVVASSTPEYVIQEDGFSFTVKEKYSSEFSMDPIAFQKKNFDILKYIDQVGNETFDTYFVSFKSAKGHLQVKFDKTGKLLENKQWFSDVVLPRNLREQLHKEHNGWIMVQNKRFSNGREGMTEKIVYRIKLENGDKTRRLRIKSKPQEEVALAQKN